MHDNDTDRPFFELVEDTRKRWSWIMWDTDGRPIAMSAITYDDLRAAAIELKYARKAMQVAPTIFYQNRKDTGRRIKKKLDKLTHRSHLT